MKTFTPNEVSEIFDELVGWYVEKGATQEFIENAKFIKMHLIIYLRAEIVADNENS